MKIRQGRFLMLLVLVLMLGLIVGCGGDANNKGLEGAGYYSLQTIVLDGDEYDAAELDMDDAYIILKEDGSAKGGD